MTRRCKLVMVYALLGLLGLAVIAVGRRVLAGEQGTLVSSIELIKARDQPQMPGETVLTRTGRQGRVFLLYPVPSGFALSLADRGVVKPVKTFPYSWAGAFAADLNVSEGFIDVLLELYLGAIDYGQPGSEKVRETSQIVYYGKRTTFWSQQSVGVPYHPFGRPVLLRDSRGNVCIAISTRNDTTDDPERDQRIFCWRPSSGSVHWDLVRYGVLEANVGRAGGASRKFVYRRGSRLWIGELGQTEAEDVQLPEGVGIVRDALEDADGSLWVLWQTPNEQSALMLSCVNEGAEALGDNDTVKVLPSEKEGYGSIDPFFPIIAKLVESQSLGMMVVVQGKGQRPGTIDLFYKDSKHAEDWRRRKLVDLPSYPREFGLAALSVTASDDGSLHLVYLIEFPKRIEVRYAIDPLPQH